MISPEIVKEEAEYDVEEKATESLLRIQSQSIFNKNIQTTRDNK